MQEIVALITSFVVLGIVLLPFFVGKGGRLASASTINDPDKLGGLKKAILNRTLEEEKAFENGDLSEGLWSQRKKLLRNRYIDVSKRLDFLKGSELEKKETAKKATKEATKEAKKGEKA